MTIAFLSAGNEDGISAIFEGLQQVKRVNLPGAHEFNYPYVGGVLHAHRARQVSSRISTIMTAKGYNLWFELFNHYLPLSY